MKFICMGFIEESSQQSLSEEDGQRRMEECFANDDELRRGRHFLGGETLESARNAVTLRDAQMSVLLGGLLQHRDRIGFALFSAERSSQSFHRDVRCIGLIERDLVRAIFRRFSPNENRKTQC